MKVVLIDDEIHCTSSLEILLKKLYPSVEILAKFNDALSAIDYLNTQKFDILFSDVEMPGMNGFELLKQISNLSFDVVFVTAYDKYAISAIKFSALSYLLKPVAEDELQECIEAWELKKNKNLGTDQLNFLINTLQSPSQIKTKIALPTTYGFEFIEIAQIIRCQSDSNYTHFYLNNNEKFLICRTLKEVEQILSANGFIRIHQSHLINPIYLKKYLKNDGGYVIMEDGEQISVSKNNKEKITEIFSQIDRN